MPEIPLREAVYAAIRQALSDALSGIPVERNRRRAIGKDEALPRLVLQDGDQFPLPGDSAVEEGATLTGRVEGYAYAPPDPDEPKPETEAGAAANLLHARTCRALFRPNEAHPELVVAGDMELWIRPGPMQFDLVPMAQGSDDLVAFYQDFELDLRFAHGEPFITQP